MDCANSGPSHNRLTANASVTAPFAYVTNGEGSISGYVVNSVTGALTEVTGSPFLALTDPRSFVVDPQKRFAYVANYGSNNLYSYTVDSITGALSGIARGPFATGGHPNSITTEPTGRYVYVATQDNGTVSHYGSVTSGVLTGFGPAVSGSHAVIIHPSAKFLYSVGPGSGVFAYSIDPSTQDLTAIPGSPFPSGLGASFIAIDPLGKFVYVANFGSGNISAYSIDQNSGSLAPIAGTPFVAGQSPRSVAIHPSGKFLYVANAGGPTSSGNVSAYVIDATTGALTQIAGSPFTAGNGLISITVEPKGKFAYVAAGSFTTDYNILSFAIDGTTGTLTAAPANTVVTNKTLTFMTITR
jgi:6-phosphogluconolactonase (cycloisomerase 2 family)